MAGGGGREERGGGVSQEEVGEGTGSDLGRWCQERLRKRRERWKRLVKVRVHLMGVPGEVEERRERWKGR